MTDTDTDPRSQATNLGGQLRGGQPDQGPPQNPFQIGGRNPWQMAVDLIRPPQGQPGIFSGERQDPTNTTPQNYIPAQRRSDHTMWGKDDAVLEGARRYPGVTPGPFMPYGQAQLAQVFHESAAGLANIGSGAVGPLGMQSAAYQTAFIKARMQKQEWEARMNQYRMRETAQRLEDEQRKESLAYGEIFAEYGDDKDKLKEALREHAIEKVGGRDQAIITALENGGTDAAKRVLQERDYYYLGLAKTNQQRKDEDAQRDTEKYLDPKQGQPAATQPAPPAPPTTQPRQPGQPVQPVQVPLPALPQVSDDLKRDAQAIQAGEKPMYVPDTRQAREGLGHYKDVLDDRMRRITDPQSNIPPDQIMPLVREANPLIADRVQNILDGNLPTAAESGKEPYVTALRIAHRINPQASGLALDAASQQVAQGIAEYRLPAPALGTRNTQNRALMAEVLRINPNYRIQGYKTVQDFRAGGKHADLMRSMDVAIDHLDALDEYAKALKSRNSQIINRARAVYQQLTGQAAPQNIQEASAFVGAEIQKALGATTQAERREAAGHFGVANSPEQAIAATQVARRLLSGQLNGLRQEYKNGTGLDDFDTLLNPRTVSVLDATRAATTPASSGALPSRDEIDAEIARRERERKAK